MELAPTNASVWMSNELGNRITKRYRTAFDSLARASSRFRPLPPRYREAFACRPPPHSPRRKKRSPILELMVRPPARPARKIRPPARPARGWADERPVAVLSISMAEPVQDAPLPLPSPARPPPRSTARRPAAASRARPAAGGGGPSQAGDGAALLHLPRDGRPSSSSSRPAPFLFFLPSGEPCRPHPPSFGKPRRPRPPFADGSRRPHPPSPDELCRPRPPLPSSPSSPARCGRARGSSAPDEDGGLLWRGEEHGQFSNATGINIQTRIGIRLLLDSI